MSLSSAQLPVRLTPLVGRESELNDIVRAVTRCRLVTLTGPGGTGKTRLALAAARAAGPSFAAGVCWVELAQIEDPAIVEQAVASRLGVPDTPGQDPAEAVAEHIQVLGSVAREQGRYARAVELHAESLAVAEAAGDRWAVAAAGRHQAAAALFRRAVAHEPLNETAHRELMSSWARLGETARAIRHYEELTELLREQVGVPPAGETTALYQRLMAAS